MTERTLISNERALHEAFERFCRETCSPGANTSEFYWRLFKAGARATDGTPQPSKNQALAELIEAAEVALTEMCHTNAPRNSFTDAVDRLDAAITFAKASADDTKANAHETLPPRITVMDDGRAMGGSDVCHTCAAHCTVINDLETALRGLYWDNVDYLTLNKLGGMQNHWMRAARMALGMDVDDVRPTQKAKLGGSFPESTDG